MVAFLDSNPRLVIAAFNYLGSIDPPPSVSKRSKAYLISRTSYSVRPGLQQFLAEKPFFYFLAGAFLDISNYLYEQISKVINNLGIPQWKRMPVQNFYELHFLLIHMGSLGPHLDLNQFQLVCLKDSFRIVIEISSKLQFQEYSLPPNQSKEFFQNLQFRKTPPKNVVLVKDFGYVESEPCSERQLKVITERVKRLSQIQNLALDQALRIYKEGIIGISGILTRYDQYFKITENMIGLTQNKEVRIWRHYILGFQDYYKVIDRSFPNRSQKEDAFSRSLQNLMKKKIRVHEQHAFKLFFMQILHPHTFKSMLQWIDKRSDLIGLKYPAFI